jgi:selenium metabolism protein YedF
MYTTIIINSQYLGKGNDDLGKTLMGSFLRKLWASDKKPDKIIFYNESIHLLTEKSAVLDALDGLSKAGVDLLACTTCVKHFQLDNKIVVGRMSDMVEIISLLMKSDRIITP